MFNVSSKEAQRQLVHSQWKLRKRGIQFMEQALKFIKRRLPSIAGSKSLVADEQKSPMTTQRGRPISPATKTLIQKVKELVEFHLRVTTRDLADLLDSPKISIHRILSQISVW
jgi:hypothetical protein